MAWSNCAVTHRRTDRSSTRARLRRARRRGGFKRGWKAMANKGESSRNQPRHRVLDKSSKVIMENTEDVSNRNEGEQNELRMKDDTPLPHVSNQWDVYALRESRTWPDGLNDLFYDAFNTRQARASQGYRTHDLLKLCLLVQNMYL
ncbi:hypothetical protein Scep_011692 [Stephania cephalantha]|uniref:Uncharacterized protein n=1 Tax=Stephania cephalantha TaxID=152367 RepID=A0AAP0JDT3_9MAGN